MNDDLQQLIAGYHPATDTVQLVQSTPIALLVGISGAGKDTIKQQLLKTGNYHHIVSHTTRAPRENGGVLEEDGVDYHFINVTEATGMLKDGAFVEAKMYSGNVYGTSAAEIRQAKEEGKIAITDLEVQGVAEYKAMSPDVVALFILPPSFEEWHQRLLARYGTKGAAPEDLQRRMQTAIVELQEALAQPYYHFIINDDLAEAVAVAHKLAHNPDSLSRVDRGFHGWAEKLLTDLSSHI